MNKKTAIVAVLMVVVLAACAAWIALRVPRAKPHPPATRPSAVQKETPRKKPIADAAKENLGPKEEDVVEDAVEKPKADASNDEDSGPDEDAIADREEALVESFDDMTDKFMEVEAGHEVTMEDVKRFHSYFKRLPAARKEECLHRALNLLPDDNVMLLAGILMDKEEKKELVELVFNDILNREDSVKQVLLQEIYKDRTHPCWADTAWILDVTGGGEEKGANKGAAKVEE